IYAMNGNVMTYSGTLLESKLILRGADLKSISLGANEPKSSAVVGNVILSQTGGISNANTLTFEMLNAGINGTVHALGSVPFTLRVFLTNSILQGPLYCEANV